MDNQLQVVETVSLNDADKCKHKNIIELLFTDLTVNNLKGRYQLFQCLDCDDYFINYAVKDERKYDTK